MSYLSDFEHTKLEAHVFPGMVVETHSVSDAIKGQRKVLQTKIWKVERLLGKGGFGEVRLEVYEEKQRAVKRIWATGTNFKLEYERELKALLEFSKPKYKESAVFVGFLGWFQDAECVYLAMEYVPLGDLEDNVAKSGGKMGESEVKEITVQILEGLKIMHLESFVHRDLKPKNVLVCRGSPNWWVKLADFGLSKRRTEDTAFRTQTGTQAYMAPEILNYIPGHSEYTYAVDIWALGCIMYRLITGTVPFPPGLSLTSFCGDGRKFASKPLNLGEPGKDFIHKLIVAHPSRRLTSEEALEHEWTKPDSENSNESLGELIAPTGDTSNGHSASFGGYNTITHAGLQSYGNGNTAIAPPAIPSASLSKPPPNRYHQPTVEDELETENVDEHFEPEEERDLAENELQPPDEGCIHRNILDQENPSKNADKQAKLSTRRQKIKMAENLSDENEFQGEQREQSQEWSSPGNRGDVPHDYVEGDWGFLEGERCKEEDENSSSYKSNSDTDPASDVAIDGRQDSGYGRGATFARVDKQSTQRRPGPTRYIVENGRSIPVEIPEDRRRTQAPTRYVVENGRSIPVEPRRSVRSPSRGDLEPPSLTAENLRKHSSKMPNRIKRTDSVVSSTLGVHLMINPTEFTRRWSSSAGRTDSPEDDQRTFYADEHGFIDEQPDSRGGEGNIAPPQSKKSDNRPSYYSDEVLDHFVDTRPQRTKSSKKRSPEAPISDPYIVEPPSPTNPPRKPALQSYSSAPPVFTREPPSRSKTQDYPRKERTSRRKASAVIHEYDPYVVEPPSPTSVPRKPTLQSYSSAPPVFTRESPSRSKTQDYPRAKGAVSSVSRAEIFYSEDYPRPATFRSGDRGNASGLRKEFTSDSEPEDNNELRRDPADAAATRKKVRPQKEKRTSVPSLPRARTFQPTDRSNRGSNLRKKVTSDSNRDEKWSEHRYFAGEYMRAARRKFPPETETAVPPLPRAQTFQSNNRAEGSSGNSESRKEVSSDSEHDEKWSEHRDFAGAYMQAERRKVQAEKATAIPPLPRAATFRSGDRPRASGSSRLRKEYVSDSESDTASKVQSSSKTQESPRKEAAIPPIRRAETSSPAPVIRPVVPEGWEVLWHEQYKEWYFVNSYTKQSFWTQPTAAVYPPGW